MSRVVGTQIYGDPSFGGALSDINPRTGMRERVFVSDTQSNLGQTRVVWGGEFGNEIKSYGQIMRFESEIGNLPEMGPVWRIPTDQDYGASEKTIAGMIGDLFNKAPFAVAAPAALFAALPAAGFAAPVVGAEAVAIGGVAASAPAASSALSMGSILKTISAIGSLAVATATKPRQIEMQTPNVSNVYQFSETSPNEYAENASVASNYGGASAFSESLFSPLFMKVIAAVLGAILLTFLISFFRR
jgi:hypothetical protein